MDIISAASVAQKAGKGMTRRAWQPGGVTIIPTNTAALLICESKDLKLSPGWMPSLDDLLAKDWITFG